MSDVKRHKKVRDAWAAEVKAAEADGSWKRKENARFWFREADKAWKAAKAANKNCQ